MLKGLQRNPRKSLEDRLWDGVKKSETAKDDKFTMEFIGKFHTLSVLIIPPGSSEERNKYQESYNMYYNYEKVIHGRYDNEEDAKLDEERIWQMRFIGLVCTKRNLKKYIGSSMNMKKQRLKTWLVLKNN